MLKYVNDLLPFHQGCLMLINSLRGLFRYLKADSYSHVMACRLNQGVIENYFSQIREPGRFYDHTLPTVVTQRITNLILSRNAGNVINNDNCSVESETNLLSTYILSKVTADVEHHNSNDATGLEAEATIGAGVFNEGEEEREFGTSVDGLVQQFQNHYHEEVRYKEDPVLLEMIAEYFDYRTRKNPRKRCYVWNFI